VFIEFSKNFKKQQFVNSRFPKSLEHLAILSDGCRTSCVAWDWLVMGCQVMPSVGCITWILSTLWFYH